MPFDPGWSPLLFLIVAVIAFASAWVAAALGRGRLGVAIPLPLVGLAAISQPSDGEFIAGLGAFLPVLAALTVLFRGGSRTDDLGGEFELKRAVRSLVLAVPLVAALVVLSSTSLLFPDPVYDPTEQPQKPKPVPLSAAADRVLFEVDGPEGLTGPWRAGVLDIYDDGAWKLPPFTRSRLQDVARGGSLSTVRTDVTQLEVTITTRDLGDSAVLPQVAGATSFGGDGGGLGYDPRTQLVRAKEGRAPRDFTYTLAYPPYPTEAELQTGSGPDRTEFADQLAVPKPPPVVRDLLGTAPENPWDRLDLLRQTLLANVTAKGAGTPDDVTIERAAALFEPNAKATPFEIVATEALLARWAGIPSRVGFGFDGLNDEDGVLTVRPRNSAQWLEVHFPEFGWVPLIGAPRQAEASLDDDLSRFDPEVVAGDDVAVEAFLPFRHDDLTQLHERIRDELIYWSPVLALIALAWIGWPAPAKAWRRAKRRRWAAGVGPAAQIAVEYVELRDLATDLNVGDIYTTPLEFVYAVRDDEEHEHFAWLHARSLYGDLRTPTEAEVAAAEAMGMSLRRRLRRGQPLLQQAGAYLSRASLHQPYSTEVPTIRVPRLPRVPRLGLVRRLRSWRRRAPRLSLRRAT